MKSFKIIFVIVLFLLSARQAKCIHTWGADITYKCLGNNQYELTYSFYRDCVGVAAKDSIDIQYSSSCDTTVRTIYLYPTSSSPTEISPTCSLSVNTCHGGQYTGIQEWIYKGIVTLPGPCADWKFGHEEFTRNELIITTLISPMGNLYVYALLNNSNGICNNSPTFSNKPIFYCCLNQNFIFNHGAFDTDGDSLSFELVTPYQSPGVPVTYKNSSSPTYFPYTYQQFLISAPPISINSVNGDVKIVPKMWDITVFAVLVNEYRNGVLIGQIERDIQLTVLDCQNKLPSLTGMDYLPRFSTTICAGQSFCFKTRSVDPDINNTTRLAWDFTIPPPAHLTIYGTHRDSAEFCWTPTISDVRNLPYIFTATIQDDNCPYIGKQIYSYMMYVEVCSNISQQEKLLGLEVFPNPAQYAFTIKAKNQQQGKISLCDISGRMMREYTEGLLNRTVDVSDIPDGIYFLTIESGNLIVQKKIVIVKE